MKSINKHISNLLFYHDCVIIPGLGGLVVNPTSAVYDESKNMFFPAGKEIGFNRNLKHDDGLLINHITQEKNISYDMAKTNVREYVETIIQKLKNKEIVSLGSAGELKSDAEEGILFSPNLTENFQTESFGLSSFHFSPAVACQRHNYTPYPSVRKVIRPLNIKHIAAGIAIVIGLFVFSPELKNPGINQAGGLEFLMSSENPVNINTPKKSTSKVISVSSINIEADMPDEKEINLNYFIIAGSFKRIEQADKYCKQLKSKGENNPLILKSPQGRFRVAIDGFSNKEEALTSLSKYRSRKGFNSAWILTQK